MDNNIIYLKDYKKLLELQQQYESGIITEDDMTLDEIDDLHKLYMSQIKNLQEVLTKKLIKKSKEWS